MLSIGHGATQLHVLPGEPLGGYADRRHGAAGTLDPLEVHALVIDDGQRLTALVVVDLICLNVDVVESTRANLRAELGIDMAWLLATHTHSGPEAGCHPGGSMTEPHLAQRLRTGVLRSVRLAVGQLRPAQLFTSRALVNDLAGRRTSEAPASMAIPIDLISVCEGETLVGVLAVSPVHPTVLPADNLHASADLSGGIRRALRDLLSSGGDGARPWAVVATGAAGDISTRFSRQERTPAEIDRLGQLVAATLLRHSSQPIPLQDRPVRFERTQISLPGSSHDELTENGTLEFTTARSAHVLRQGMDIARALRQRPRESYTMTIEALRIGSLTLVAVPAELFLQLGEAIRSCSPGPVIVMGYANGYLGYLPTHDAPPGYEVLVSPVARGSGERVVAAAQALVARFEQRTGPVVPQSGRPGRDPLEPENLGG